MKKLYYEKLIDPEFLTDTAASWTAIMTTNSSSFATFDWIGVLDTFANQVKKQNPDYDLEYGNKAIAALGFQKIYFLIHPLIPV